MVNARLTRSWSLLRYSYALVILIVGLDKILGTDLVVNWPKYISPFVLNHLPVSVPTFLLAMGIIEIAVGILMFTKFWRIAGYLSIAWLLLISVNLLLARYIDVAVRDILLAIGAYVSTELGRAVEEERVVSTHA